MATPPGNYPALLPESQAPPPSPIAGASSGALESSDDDELDGFLKHSLRVPKLTLPDRIFPHDATPWKPPEIDLRRLIPPDYDGSVAENLCSAAAAFGCFQLVNHGIPGDLIAGATAVATAAFRIPPERKKAALRSPERRWGFEVEEEERAGGEGDEYFWWSWSGKRDAELAGIWPEGFKDSGDKIGSLWQETEMIARKIETILESNNVFRDRLPSLQSGDSEEGSTLCVHKHDRHGTCDAGPKRHFLLMLIRSISCSHALSLHFCGGASAFHVYSKRGWFTFCPDDKALVVTIGDQIQACTSGLYKHVIGKPAFHLGDHKEPISLAFFYSRPSASNGCPRQTPSRREETISVAQQILITMCVMLFYHIVFYLFDKI